MLNFNYHIPTKVFFGKGRIADLADTVKEYGKRVLVVTYEKNSPAEQKICDEVYSILEDAGISFWKFDDVSPNPNIMSVIRGAHLCREHDVQLVLAVGGGSAIDCSKGIAAAACYSGDPWELVLDNSKVVKALPVGSVVTIAAAGSEMNYTAVISNDATKEKLHLFSELVRPKFAIMDPTYTYSVPRSTTAACCADILSHAMEVYFSNTPETYVQNRMAEAMMKTVVHYSETVLSKPDDYESRANLMWASALTINGMLAYGKIIQWSTHYIEHTVSAFYNVPHGVGIAVILPVWMEYVLDEHTLGNFFDFARNVWNIPEGDDDFKTALQGIDSLRHYLFSDLGLPSSLSELGVEENMLESMAGSAVGEGPIKGTKLLLKDDVLAILKEAF